MAKKDEKDKPHCARCSDNLEVHGRAKNIRE
jgi:hypothetical protein